MEGRPRLAGSLVRLLRGAGVGVPGWVDTGRLLDLVVGFVAAHKESIGRAAREAAEAAGRAALRERIACTSRAALERRRRAGARTGGSPPYGWRREGDRWVRCAREQATVAAARRLRAAEPHLSLRAIAERLEAMGHRSRGGRRLHPGTVRRILSPGRWVVAAGGAGGGVR